jgi:hypothetical protein
MFVFLIFRPLETKWHFSKNQQEHVLLLSVPLNWLSIDNSYILSQNPILHNYNILLKLGAVCSTFYHYLLLQNLGDMQSETSPATSISVHQGTQHCNCHIYCPVNPTSHNVLYYWCGGSKEMSLQSLTIVTKTNETLQEAFECYI